LHPPAVADVAAFASSATYVDEGTSTHSGIPQKTKQDLSTQLPAASSHNNK
jgi:hypothetical protein